MSGNLAALWPLDRGVVFLNHGSFGARLFEDWRIEVPVMSWPAAPRRLVRISAQLYNRREHYERLAEALRKELTR